MTYKKEQLSSRFLVQFFCPNSCTQLSELSAIWHKHIMTLFIVKYTDMSVMPVVLWKARALRTASSCSFSGTSAFNLTMQVQENGHNFLVCDMWIEGQVSSLNSMSIPAPVSVPMEQNRSVVWVGRHLSRSSGSTSLSQGGVCEVCRSAKKH